MTGARGAALAVGLALLGCGHGGGAGPGEPGDRPTVRLVLPALDGGEIDLAAYRGRVVVLHLFDTATPSATLDVDQLAALAAREPRRVRVVGVALDREGYAMVAAWRRALSVKYLVALADPALRDGATPLGPVRVIPTTVVLDAAGAVAARIERPLRRGELDKVVAPVLGAR